MKNDLSEQSSQSVNHQKSVSSLQKRRPSKAEDEKFHSQLDSSHNAAKLRMSSSDEKLHTFHTPVEFSWSQFWIAFIYENLPPVFVSPIAALLIERSFSRAWNVTQHRSLCAVSTKHTSLGSIIFSWVIIYPSSWLITGCIDSEAIWIRRSSAECRPFSNDTCIPFPLHASSDYFSKIWVF